MKLKFGQYFAADVWLRLRGLITKVNFVKTFSTRFGQEFEVEVQARF